MTDDIALRLKMILDRVEDGQDIHLTTRRDTIADAFAEIMQLRRTRNDCWINIGIRSPEDGQRCLMWNGQGAEVAEGIYSKQLGDGGGFAMLAVCNHKDGRHYEAVGGVVLWMPLPVPALTVAMPRRRA